MVRWRVGAGWAAAAVAAGPGPAAAGPPANAFCPVMPAEKASPEYVADHRGRKVYFCCQSCVAKFEAAPERYLRELAPPRPNPRPADWAEWVLPVLDAVAAPGRASRPAAAGLGVLVVVAGGLVARRRAAKGGRPTAVGRAFAWASRPTVLAVAVPAGACGELWVRWTQAEEAAAAADVRAAAAAAQAHLGQAQLLTWSWPQGLHGLPGGVSATYYRGNDERSDKLFNGGNYRTCTFHLALEAADGAAVEPGAEVGPGGLRLRFRFVRAAGTAAQFFRDDAMTKAALVPAPGTAGDVTRLAVVRPGWEWAAAVPVGAPPAAGYGGLRGVWLVCSTAAPPSPQYYIQYVLHFRDGVLQPESRVWMVPTLLSPVLAGPGSDAEWFSDRPIPEIAGPNATDPKLLGLAAPDGPPGPAAK